MRYSVSSLAIWVGASSLTFGLVSPRLRFGLVSSLPACGILSTNGPKNCRPVPSSQPIATLSIHSGLVFFREIYMAKCWIQRFLLLVLAGASPVHGGNWRRGGGRTSDGSSDERNLPSLWSRTENVAWSGAVRDGSLYADRVGDRVFLSGVDSAEIGSRDVFRPDRRGRKLLWKRDVARGIRQDDRSTYASASPVTDGKQAIFFFGNGDLICFDPAGSQRWRNIQKDYGPFAFNWTFSSSPLLYDGKLYLPVLQRDVPVRGPRPGRPREPVVLAGPRSGKRQDPLGCPRPEARPRRNRGKRSARRSHSPTTAATKCCSPAGTR